MADISMQRGSKGLLDSLRKGARQVSESNGVADIDKKSRVIESMPEAGAFASIQKRSSVTSIPKPVMSTPIASKPVKSITEGYSEKRFLDHLLESVSTVGSTKEYFNAVNSLFTLYAMGQLTEGVLSSMSREDLREVKGILREFKGILDSY